MLASQYLHTPAASKPSDNKARSSPNDPVGSLTQLFGHIVALVDDEVLVKDLEDLAALEICHVVPVRCVIQCDFPGEIAKTAEGVQDVVEILSLPAQVVERMTSAVHMFPDSQGIFFLSFGEKPVSWQF